MKISIVMYHYVREIKKSQYPNVKGLELEGFKRQLDYLEKNHAIISPSDFIAYIKGEIALPDNACLLTFDDGYKDHYKYVLPELLKRKISGCFFPPARPIIDKCLLDVNAIHFIIACCNDVKKLINNLKEECFKYDITLKDLNHLKSNIKDYGRYDSNEITFFKRILQRELPFDIRANITRNLFVRYVNKTEETFCRELYMSLNEVKELISEGMYVGSHTYNHYWLNSIDKQDQEIEIDKSLEFLSSIGSRTADWIMCYPYGSYNADTLAILKEKNCIAGLTTKAGYANFKTEDVLELSRFDTNDFPQ